MRIKEILESATAGSTNSGSMPYGAVAKKSKKGQKLNLLGFPVEGHKNSNIVKRNMP